MLHNYLNLYIKQNMPNSMIFQPGLYCILFEARNFSRLLREQKESRFNPTESFISQMWCCWCFISWSVIAIGCFISRSPKSQPAESYFAAKNFAGSLSTKKTHCTKQILFSQKPGSNYRCPRMTNEWGIF